MKYALAFSFMSLVLALGSRIYPAAALPLLWSALSFGMVAFGYAGVGPKVFGKRADGTIPPGLKLLHFPYLAFTWVTWHACRLFSREAAFNRITDDLVIGRRLLSREVPADFDHYVDLTAEFDEPAPIRTGPAYRCLPILDAGVPSLEELRHHLAKTARGKVFVHCAQGHGRTGLFALAWLHHQGTVRTIEEGEHLLRSLRPAIRLNRTQRRFARNYLAAASRKTAAD